MLVVCCTQLFICHIHELTMDLLHRDMLMLQADMNDMLQPMLDAHKQDHDQETKAQIQESGLDYVKNTSKGNTGLYFYKFYRVVHNLLLGGGLKGYI